MLSAAIVFKKQDTYTCSHEFLIMLQFNLLSAATSFPFNFR